MIIVKKNPGTLSCYMDKPGKQQEYIEEAFRPFPPSYHL
jgi:hypothetical protein